MWTRRGPKITNLDSLAVLYQKPVIHTDRSD